jgi:hypothetical protein
MTACRLGNQASGRSNPVGPGPLLGEIQYGAGIALPVSQVQKCLSSSFDVFAGEGLGLNALQPASDDLLQVRPHLQTTLGVSPTSYRRTFCAPVPASWPVCI